MNCEMCYVRLDRAAVERGGGLHTAKEWIEIGQQMRDAGVLFLLLTGGEPLLFPGFRELYEALRQMGFVLTINTNGTAADVCGSRRKTSTMKTARASRCSSRI